jgi:hypothetical protein
VNFQNLASNVPFTNVDYDYTIKVQGFIPPMPVLVLRALKIKLQGREPSLQVYNTGIIEPIK